jgi:7-cyano-7-deazaguanine synthase
MLYEYQDRIAIALSFDYGSNHNKNELPLARKNCERLGIKNVVINLDFIGKLFHSSLLEGADKIPEGNYNDANMHSTVVPFRNGIMLSIAAGLAESEGLRYIMMANHAGDHTIYPDCRPEFVAGMNEAVKQGTFEHIQLWAPYTGLTKTDIVKRGAQLGIDYADTWSCYKGGDIHCGKCGTCMERKEAFLQAGIPDPTIYKE